MTQSGIDLVIRKKTGGSHLCQMFTQTLHYILLYSLDRCWLYSSFFGDRTRSDDECSPALYLMSERSFFCHTNLPSRPTHPRLNNMNRPRAYFTEFTVVCMMSARNIMPLPSSCCRLFCYFPSWKQGERSGLIYCPTIGCFGRRVTFEHPPLPPLPPPAIFSLFFLFFNSTQQCTGKVAPMGTGRGAASEENPGGRTKEIPDSVAGGVSTAVMPNAVGDGHRNLLPSTVCACDACLAAACAPARVCAVFDSHFRAVLICPESFFLIFGDMIFGANRTCGWVVYFS